jgi:hypothetical protein
MTWDVPGKTDGARAVKIAWGIIGEARQFVSQQFGDLENAFPFDRNFHFHAHFDAAGWFGLRVVLVPGISMAVGPRMEAKDVEYLKSKIEPFTFRLPPQVQELLGAAWYGVDRFTYIGPYEGTRVSWPDIHLHVLSWLMFVAAPMVVEKNRARVLRAIPPPPNYDIGVVSKALWVLECEETCRQGTAFDLAGVGIVTCEHVLGTATKAFRYDRPQAKFNVHALTCHKVIDLAVLAINGPSGPGLVRGDASLAKQMDHILVAGHPNHQIGDSPIVVPGLVVGFRMKSGIRRILTNAAIVAGSSGGPVVDRDNRVIGVAVTGAKSFDKTGETENLGIVPIDALDLLQLPSA